MGVGQRFIRSTGIVLLGQNKITTPVQVTNFPSTTNAVAICSCLNPCFMTNLQTFSMVAAGRSHSMTLATDGKVWAWGHNAYGEVGGSVAYPIVTNPILVRTVNLSPLTNVASIAAGCASYTSYAVQSNGTVWAWGYNYYGELGAGSTGGQSYYALPVPNLTGVIGVVVGNYHALALTTNGTVYAWGYNGNGQLGNGTSGTYNLSSVPILVTNLTNTYIVAVAAGYISSYALDSHGNVYAWGGNAAGQLGIGTTTDSPVPVLVSGITSSSIIGISAGYHHCLAEAVYRGFFGHGGSNSQGQMGSGSTTPSTILTPLHLNFADGSPSIGIAGGIAFSLSIQSDWTLRSWGWNYTGELE